MGRYIEDDEVVFVEIISEGVEQEVGFLLNVSVSPQDEEDVEAQFFQEHSIEVVLAPHHHSRYGGDGILVVVLVVEFAEAGHFFLDPLVLDSQRSTDFDM